MVVELAWDLPTDQVVTMDMWMSSASIESNKFLKEIRDPDLIDQLIQCKKGTSKRSQSDVNSKRCLSLDLRQKFGDWTVWDNGVQTAQIRKAQKWAKVGTPTVSKWRLLRREVLLGIQKCHGSWTGVCSKATGAQRGHDLQSALCILALGSSKRIKKA